MKKTIKAVLFAALFLSANSALSHAEQAFDGPNPMCIPPVNCQVR